MVKRVNFKLYVFYCNGKLEKKSFFKDTNIAILNLPSLGPCLSSQVHNGQKALYLVAAVPTSAQGSTASERDRVRRGSRPLPLGRHWHAPYKHSWADTGRGLEGSEARVSSGGRYHGAALFQPPYSASSCQVLSSTVQKL